MNRKLLSQVCDCLRPTPLHPDQRVILALQLIAWTLLSARRRIEPPLSTDAFLDSSANEIPSAFSGIEGVPDPIGQALAGCFSAMNTAGPQAIRSALQLCRKLEADGLLQRFTPIGDVAEMLAEERGGPAGRMADLSELMVGLARVTRKETVYCAWDEYAQLSGRLLSQARQVFTENKVFSPLPALMNLLVGGELEVHFGDAIRAPAAVEKGALRKFDVAVAMPPFGVPADPQFASNDLFNRFRIPKATWIALAIEHLVARAKRRVVVLVPNSLMFGPGADRALRELLLSEGKVQAVIALPGGLLQGSNLVMSILVLSPNVRHDAVRFVNADHDRFRTLTSKAKASLTGIDELIDVALGSAAHDCVADVPVSDVLANDAQLQVSRYVVPLEQRKLQAALAKMPRLALSDVVETVRPLSTVATKTDSTIEVHEVAAADLPRHGFISSTSRPVYVAAEVFGKARHQLLQPNDIVLIVKGSTGKVGIVPPDAPPQDAGGWVAVQSATVLRTKRDAPIAAHALFLLLRSSFGQQLLTAITSGAVIPLVSLRELLRMEIPLPTLEEGAKASEVLRKEAELQAEIEALQRRQAVVSKSLWSFE